MESELAKLNFLMNDMIDHSQGSAPSQFRKLNKRGDTKASANEFT